MLGRQAICSRPKGSHCSSGLILSNPTSLCAFVPVALSTQELSCLGMNTLQAPGWALNWTSRVENV
ncbi:hypothetical protein MPLA_730068 [Mesorhizobium sp. ORS 3359]|nr:hypothetical protein MPLA_730068 [Mesorhizobium sp. ORS 3359]